MGPQQPVHRVPVHFAPVIDQGGPAHGTHKPINIVWRGHSTVDIGLGGSRILTDPILRDRLAHLVRHGGVADLGPSAGMGPVDLVVISHLHHDHLDLPSLRRLPPDTPVVVPRGAARLVARAAPGDVVEVAEGDEVQVGEVTVTAVPADHHPDRLFRRAKAAPLGFVMTARDQVVYFPGDTDLHPVMADLPAPDVALLPIWGWGRSLGPGHLDPRRAAEAAGVLRARAVLPVHWGTFAPAGFRRRPPSWLHRAGDDFARMLGQTAPQVHLALNRPGPDVITFDAG